MANTTNNRFARIESFLFLLCMSTCNFVIRCMGSLAHYSLHCHAPNIFHDIKVWGDILNYFSKNIYVPQRGANKIIEAMIACLSDWLKRSIIACHYNLTNCN